MYLLQLSKNDHLNQLLIKLSLNFPAAANSIIVAAPDNLLPTL